MTVRFAIFCAGACLALLAQAQGSRDPTQAPPEAGLTVPFGATTGAAPAAPNYSVIVQDGQPRLVVGTRLIAPGQMVGASKLERITETEVWLLNGKELRKVPRFAGIQRTPVVAASAPTQDSKCLAVAGGKSKRTTSSKPSTLPVAPDAGCTTVQP